MGRADCFVIRRPDLINVDGKASYDFSLVTLHKAGQSDEIQSDTSVK